jgi:hypothetical protein
MAPSLVRRLVCNLLLLLGLANRVPLGSESRGTQEHILLSQFFILPNLEIKVLVFISRRSRVAQLYPQALGSLFIASYDLQSYGGGSPTLLHTTGFELNTTRINT